MAFRFLLFLILIISHGSTILVGQIINNNPASISKNPYFADAEIVWVDSVFNNLTLEQKVGQLFIVAAYSNHLEGEYLKVDNLIDKYTIGGLIFMQGTPVAQAKLTNRYQNIAKVPLLISFDGEWGLGMRLSNVISYPKAITLGAIKDNNLIYKMGADIAEQCVRLGIHLNFAPDADINSNGENPVIGFRSFGENRINVAQKAIAYMKGLQHNGVIANAKHFPGHGDANDDSHFNLPKIDFNLERLTDIELYPFRDMIKDSLMSIITGHLLVPSVKDKNIATSLSGKTVTDLLKTKMGFKGLMITDALNMQGATKGNLSAGDIELQAFLAGNDLLLMPENAIAGITKIIAAINDGKIQITDLDFRVKKILKAKYWAGLSNKINIIETDITEELNQQKYLGLKQILYENAVTVASNPDNLIPLDQSAKPNKIVSIAIGAELDNNFQKTLLKFGDIQLFSNESKSDDDWYTTLLNTLDTGKTIIVSLHKLSNSPSRRYGISPTTMGFLTSLQKQNKVILVVLGNPYAIKYFPDIQTVICGYEDDPLAEEAAAQVISGALPAIGLLPVSVGSRFRAGDGIYTKSRQILGFSLPEAVGINSVALSRIDNIVNNAIEQKVMPGCNILIARKSKITYAKSFGNLQYESGQKVNQNTIYDLASVTKDTGKSRAVNVVRNRARQVDVNAEQFRSCLHAH